VSASTPLLVFYGYGAEFNLRPLAAHLAERGHRTEVIDAHEVDAAPRLRALAGRELYFFTSAHLERDRHQLAALSPGLSAAASPLEIIGQLRPRRSFYYPHDLTTPFVLGEHLYLDLFDCVLAPFDELRLYARYCRRIETVGWIKLSPSVLAQPPLHDWVWLYSDFVHYTKIVGLSGMWERCARLVGEGVKLKFPDWPGADEATRYFNERAPGCALAPQESALELIWRARGVITNSITSCLIEADLLGKPSVNIAEPYHAPDLARRAFALTRHALFCDSAADVDLAALARVPPGERRMGPFDFAKCEAIIAEALAAD
jgi:hypothetical protein